MITHALHRAAIAGRPVVRRGHSLARLCPAFLALVCCAANHGHAAPNRQATATLAFRHYALGSCLRQAFPYIGDEADAAKDGYLQNGSHPAEAYMAIQSMAEKWLQKYYPGYRNVPLNLIKCVDFAESPAVSDLARRTLLRD